MADYVGTDVNSNAGVVVTERSGTAASDTVRAGDLVLWRNTGAGSHTVTVTTNNTEDDLAVADQTVVLAAGQNKVQRINKKWGDANGRCAIGIDGTATEVKYSVLAD